MHSAQFLTVLSLLLGLATALNLRAHTGVRHVIPRDSVQPGITEIMDQLSQVDFHGLCERPESEKMEQACVDLTRNVVSCLVRWQDDCLELADFLVQRGIDIPGFNPRGNGMDRNLLSSLDSVPTELLLERVAAFEGGLLNQNQLSIPVGCQKVCTRDVNTLSRAYLCLICQIVDSLFHAAPSANTTVSAILD